MKRGEIINGYEVLRDFTTAGGGLSKWTFARRSGEEFFLKEFLAPTYPTDDAPGSAATKERKREKCAAFEDHQRSVGRAIAGACGPGGNLVYARDFFRWGTKYYKVSDKIDVASMDVADVAGLPLDHRLLILKTVAHSLGILHRAGIVHADLKPGNVLIKRSATGRYVAKLIDFDSSFFAGNPPETQDEVVGDLVFYAPEMARYVQGGDDAGRGALQESVDIFALGILYSLYLTGDLPLFDRGKYAYPCEAVNDGCVLQISRLDGDLPDALAGIVEEMLAPAPTARPTIDVVFRRLKAPTTTHKSGPTAGGSSGLRGRLLAKDPSPSPDARTAPPSVPGQLTGKLFRKDR